MSSSASFTHLEKIGADLVDIPSLTWGDKWPEAEGKKELVCALSKKLISVLGQLGEVLQEREKEATSKRVWELLMSKNVCVNCK